MRELNAPSRPFLPRGQEAGKKCARAYEPPSLTRVHVQTSRMTLGYRDAVSHCTVHDHDTGINPCTIS